MSSVRLTSSILPPNIPLATPSKPSRDLIYYVNNKKVPLVEFALKQKADPNVRSNGFSMLHLASQASQVSQASQAANEKIVLLLLEHKANANITTEGGRTTPLHNASAQVRKNIVRILLEAKADATTQDEHGPLGQPLQYALASDDQLESLACAELLIAARADVNKVNEATGLSPLCIACQKGHLAAVRLLIEANANPNPEHGIKPLNQALPFPNIVAFLESLHPPLEIAHEPSPTTGSRRKKRTHKTEENIGAKPSSTVMLSIDDTKRKKS